VKVLAITKDRRFPQLNEMDTAEGYIDDGLARSTLASFRYGIEKDIGTVVDTGVIVQIAEKYIVCNNGPLFVV
jgi:hypothetical protein